MKRQSGARKFGFPASARLRRRREYLAVQGGGVRQFSKHFMVFLSPSDSPESRLGVTASKKVGNAVRRNRWKRVAREAFRHLRPRLQGRPSVELVVVARKGVEPPSSDQARRELWGVLQRWFKRGSRA